MTAPRVHSPKEIKNLIHHCLKNYKYKKGKLFWRKGHRLAGKQVSLTPYKITGYVNVYIQGKMYWQHRIIWLMKKGYMPENGLDHKDGDRANNRIGNLREASHSCNMQNCGLSKSNSSGITGVYWDKQKLKWQAQITCQGKTIHLGFFASKKKAAAARYSFEIFDDRWHCDKRNTTLACIEAEFGKKFARKLEKRINNKVKEKVIVNA